MKKNLLIITIKAKVEYNKSPKNNTELKLIPIFVKKLQINQLKWY